MNPIEILYSWQAVLVACAATGLTQLVKVIIDVRRGHADPTPTPTVRDMAKVGKDLREGDEILNRIVLPSLPILFGVLTAVIVPARPDPITSYVTDHHVAGIGAYLIFAAWGAACGQFADYIFVKVKGVMSALAGGARTSSPPARRDDPPEHESDDSASGS